MLPLLLAVLLPSSSFDNVLIDTSVSPRTVAMDTVADVPPGPLTGKTWGLGFRVLGDAPEVMIHGALSPRVSLTLQAMLRGSSISEPSGKLEGDSTLFDLEVSAPVRIRFACDDRLCATAGIGPLFRAIQSEGLHRYVYRDTTTWSQKTSHSETRVGLIGSLGATVEILPGVFLASELGLKGWFAFGDSDEELVYPKTSGLDNHLREGDISNKGLSSWFGGIGLDAWF